MTHLKRRRPRGFVGLRPVSLAAVEPTDVGVRVLHAALGSGRTGSGLRSSSRKPRDHMRFYKAVILLVGAIIATPTRGVAEPSTIDAVDVSGAEQWASIYVDARIAAGDIALSASEKSPSFTSMAAPSQAGLWDAPDVSAPDVLGAFQVRGGDGQAPTVDAATPMGLPGDGGEDQYFPVGMVRTGTVDENGVDHASGRHVWSQTDLSIGPQNGGLANSVQYTVGEDLTSRPQIDKRRRPRSRRSGSRRSAVPARRRRRWCPRLGRRQPSTNRRRRRRPQARSGAG